MAKGARIYIACSDFDFSWQPEQVRLAVSCWEEGMPLPEMAEKFRRRQEKMLLLLVDLAARGEVTARPGGILGKVG